MSTFIEVVCGQCGMMAQSFTEHRSLKGLEVYVIKRRHLLIIREPYKVRKPKIVWKFPNLGGGGGQPQVNFQTIFKVCRMVKFVQKCKENFFDF